MHFSGQLQPGYFNFRSREFERHVSRASDPISNRERPARYLSAKRRFRPEDQVHETWTPPDEGVEPVAIPQPPQIGDHAMGYRSNMLIKGVGLLVEICLHRFSS